MEIAGDLIDDDLEDSCFAREECIEELLKDVVSGCLYCRMGDEDEY